MSTTPKTSTPPVDDVNPKVEAPLAPVTVSAPATAPARKATPARPVTRPAAKPAARAVAVKSAPTSTASKVAKPATPPAPAKPVAKPLAKAFAQGARPVKAEETAKPTKPAQAAKLPKAEKPAKQKRIKLISDKFKLLKDELAVLNALRKRAAKASLPAKKSALLRAGIKALAGMNDAAFAAALGNLPGTPPATAKGKKA